jgi:hypothetical protein
MYEAVFVQPWPWWAAGPAVGLCVLALYFLANKPLGVSTGFGTACGIVSSATVFQEEEYRQGWRLTFILGIFLGALVAAQLAGAAWPTQRMGRFDDVVSGSLSVKAPLFFAGGILIGFGSRLAGGCTSGHSITGVALLAPSSLLASGCFFAGGLLVANALTRALGG